MDYNERNENFKIEARHYANLAHCYQVDKGGAPYINHVVNVANRAVTDLTFNSGTYTAVYCTGILHDVLEDSNVLKVTELFEIFGNEIGEAVVAITHAHNEPWTDYLERVKANEIATRVKIADLRENVDIDRAIRVRRVGNAADYKRLTKVLIPRYIAALDDLT